MPYLLALLLLLLATPLRADWLLDNEASRLSFTTIKAGSIAETHRFTRLAGSVSEDGGAEVVIELASVATGIEIRDERMREILFQTVDYPLAAVTAAVAVDELENLPVGATALLPLELVIDLIGIEQAVNSELLIARLGEDTMLISTASPITVDAASFGLADEVLALQEIAGLPSISNAVTVTLLLTFRAAD